MAILYKIMKMATPVARTVKIQKNLHKFEAKHANYMENNLYCIVCI